MAVIFIIMQLRHIDKIIVTASKRYVVYSEYNKLQKLTEATL